MVVAAGNAGRVDILLRSLELIDQSSYANNPGLLVALLTQFIRCNHTETMQPLIERLVAIEEEQLTSDGAQATLRDEAEASPEPDADADIYVRKPIAGTRPYAYFGAIRALVAEHARRKDAAALVSTLDLLSRTGVSSSSSMRNMVQKTMESVGFGPFLRAVKQMTGAVQAKDAAPHRPLHPDTLGLIARCAAAVCEGKLSKGMASDALRLGGLAKTAICRSSAQHCPRTNNNYSSYRALVQLYRNLGVKPAIEDLLRSFDDFNVVVRADILEVALPGLRLAQFDRVMQTLRDKGNPIKPSIGLFSRVAEALHPHETIPDFLNLFIANLQREYPDLPIQPRIINRALHTYGKALQVEKATAIFNLMHPASARHPCDITLDVAPLCKADADTYSGFLSVLGRAITTLETSPSDQALKVVTSRSKEELVAMGKQTFETARQRMLLVGPEVYAAMARFWLAARQVGQADLVLYQMREAGYTPKAYLYQAVIEGFLSVGNKESAEQLERQLRQL